MLALADTFTPAIPVLFTLSVTVPLMNLTAGWMVVDVCVFMVALMLPLASNLQAQAFHKKHGARLVARIRTRGHLMHELQKELPPLAE